MAASGMDQSTITNFYNFRKKYVELSASKRRQAVGAGAAGSPTGDETRGKEVEEAPRVSHGRWGTGRASPSPDPGGRAGRGCGGRTGKKPPSSEKQTTIDVCFQSTGKGKDSGFCGGAPEVGEQKTPSTAGNRADGVCPEGRRKRAWRVRGGGGTTEGETPGRADPPTPAACRKKCLSRKRLTSISNYVRDQGEREPSSTRPSEVDPDGGTSREETKVQSDIQEDLSEKLGPITSLMQPVSPLPSTPKKLREMRGKVEFIHVKPSLEASITKCKSLLVLDNDMDNSPDTKTSEDQVVLSAEVIKARLAKCGKLEELKKQLKKMGDIRTTLKKPLPKLKRFNVTETEVQKPAFEEKTPAFEKFHSLAAPAPPTLLLPYKYIVLADTFRSMDMVVSLLHNRSEICTFLKLKAAVQKMTKRNFELSNVSQIKTVAPTAYNFHQEKCLGSFGNKMSDYHLVVEANLDGDTSEKQLKKEKKPFKASHLIKRKKDFNNSLICIIKRHHKKFLSQLPKPLSVPDDKITRWHPSFPLDQVPDIVLAPLPEQPFLKKYQSAKDVLEITRGTLPTKVENALILVSEKNAIGGKSGSTSNSECEVNCNQKLKGIPQTLLNRIRAKESQRLASSLMQDPEQDRKIAMLGRLPNIVRMLRTYFITEKKPAILRDHVIEKLTESYNSSISAAEVEAHIQLLLELMPDWLTSVATRKGKYLKIDKDTDLQQVTNKINSTLKSYH